MSQEANVLQAQLRTKVGKGAARELRRNEMVPAVIYGDKKDPVSISLPFKELSMRVNRVGFLTTIAKIEVDGETHQVLPKDYQVDPVRDFITHVDFLRVTARSRVVVMIPVTFLNEEESPGLRRGGVLNIVRHEIELECPATDIPDTIDVDLTDGEIGDSFHISAVKLPENATLTITDRDFTIATIAGAAAALEEEEEIDEEPIETEIIGEASDDEEAEETEE
ncbi:MAG: 50S ribosomal protein L25/general stress protein Ctc [Pseudomonadota bacterium]